METHLITSVINVSTIKSNISKTKTFLYIVFLFIFNFQKVVLVV